MYYYQRYNGIIYDCIYRLRFDPEEDSFEDLFKCRHFLENYSDDYKILLVVYIPIDIDIITKNILKAFSIDNGSMLNILIVKNKYMFC